MPNVEYLPVRANRQWRRTSGSGRPAPWRYFSGSGLPANEMAGEVMVLKLEFDALGWVSTLQ